MPDIVKYTGPHAALVQSKIVPAIAKDAISQDDWDAMPDDEKAAAIEFFMSEQADTTDGLKITFPRIKYPTSGSGVFEIPSASQPDFKPSIKGVIVAKHTVRAWWPIDAPVANNPPECFSDDAITPNASSPKRQSARCDTCPQSQFGSGKSTAAGEQGRGQACKQRINVFMLRDTEEGKLEEIPTLLSIPPTGLKPFSEFAVQVRKQGSFLSQCTEFALQDSTNRDGTKYKGLVLKMARKLKYEEMKMARGIADAFRDQMQSRGMVPEDDSASSASHVIDSKAEEVPF